MSQIRSLIGTTGYQLLGYLPSKDMSQLARELGIVYLGAPDFYQKAGSKIGLLSFAEQYDLPTIHSYVIEKDTDTSKGLKLLLEKGYSQAVLKSNVSLGGYGYQLVDLLAAEEVGFELRGIGIHPPSQPYLAQGWLSQDYIESMISIDVLINGSPVFTHAKTRIYSSRPFNYVNATYLPISETDLKNLMPIAKKLAAAYTKEGAMGPHCANFIFPSKKACSLLGFEYGVPLIHDENTRIGAGYMAHSWVRWIRSGQGGTGWMVRSIKVNPKYDFEKILKLLSKGNLLIESRESLKSGVFAYNGITGGHVDVIALASDSNTQTALEMIIASQELLE